MKFLRLASSGLLFTCASVCMAKDPNSVPGAEALDLSNEEFANVARTSYSNSPQLPDGIAFITTIRAITIINGEEPASAEGMVMLRMGLDLDSAQKIITSMQIARDEYDSEVRNLIAEMGCDYGVPKVEGEPVFSLLESIDDAKDELATDHLVVFQEKLDANTAARFQLWLQKRKLSVVHINFNHKELAKVVGNTNVDAEMTTLCSELSQSAVGAH